jgi:hypothetical protein
LDERFAYLGRKRFRHGRRIIGPRKGGKYARHATDRITEADIGAPEAQAESAFREYQTFNFIGLDEEAARSKERYTRLGKESPKAAERVRELDAEFNTVPPTEQPTAQPEAEQIIGHHQPTSCQTEQTQEPAQMKGAKMISKAIETALEAHEGESRKGTEIPYVTHPLAVGIILAKAGCTDDVIAAGILHDTVENTGITLDDVRVKCGAKVAGIVQGCSEPDRGASWEERKQHTIDFLKSTSKEIKFVALADKLHNISSMAADYQKVGERLWDRFNALEEEQKWYYEGLVVALRDDTADDAYQELHRKFARTVEAVFGAPEMKEG